MSGVIYIGGSSRGGMPSLTFAKMLTLSTAAYKGRMVAISDFGGVPYISDGTKFSPCGPITLLSAGPVLNINTSSETIQAQSALIPAGMIRAGSKIRFLISLSKSASSDTAACRLRVGSLGTTGDSAPLIMPTLATTNRSMVWDRMGQRIDATHINWGFDTGSSTSSYTAATGADQADVSIADLDAQGNYLSLTVWRSSGSTETINLKYILIQLIP